MRKYIDRTPYHLRRVRVHSGLSQETECFEAHLYRGDEFVGTVANRGIGGPHEYGTPMLCRDPELVKAAASLPPSEWEGMTFQRDVDGLVDWLLWEHLNRKQAQVFLVFCHPDNPGEIQYIQKGRARARVGDQGSLDWAMEHLADRVLVTAERITREDVARFHGAEEVQP